MKTVPGHKSDGYSLQIIYYWQWHMSHMGTRCWKSHQENAGESHAIFSLHICVTIIEALTPEDYSICHFFWSGLYPLVSGVSDLLPENKDPKNSWRTWKEVLRGFRDADLLQVWAFLQTAWKGAVYFLNWNPSLITRHCQVTINIFFFRSHK